MLVYSISNLPRSIKQTLDVNNKITVLFSDAELILDECCGVVRRRSMTERSQ